MTEKVEDPINFSRTFNDELFQAELKDIEILQLRGEIQRLKEKLEKGTPDCNPKQLENSLHSSLINSLQEDLEYYYAKYESTRKLQFPHQNPSDFGGKHSDPFPLSVIEYTSADIIGSYKDDLYEDVNLRINNVVFSDGRVCKDLTFKLCLVRGKVGFESREVDNHDSLFQKRDRLFDDYGFYFRVVPELETCRIGLRRRLPPSEFVCRDELTFMERQYLRAILSCAKKILCSEKNGQFKSFDAVKSTKWKVCVSDLIFHTGLDYRIFLPGKITLKERHAQDGYEHIWISLGALSFHGKNYQNFEFKLAVVGPKNKLVIEIRDFDNGQQPVDAWPPMTKDQFGNKFTLDVFTKRNSIFVSTNEIVSQCDKQIFIELISNLPKILKEMISAGSLEEINFEPWLSMMDLFKGKRVKFSNKNIFQVT